MYHNTGFDGSSLKKWRWAGLPEIAITGVLQHWPGLKGSVFRQQRTKWWKFKPPGLSRYQAGLMPIWVDLADPTKHMVWVGTHNGGIWKTNDISMVTPIWTPVLWYDGLHGYWGICQDPTNTNIMYVGTGDKTNVGDVRGGWTMEVDGSRCYLEPAIWYLRIFNISKIVCDAAGRVYIASNLSGGIMRSADGGNTWINITGRNE